ncbi:MAG: CHAT domain-containing protein [Nostocales cyanobacterium 94392]|nr:CHAT domain-containing protein [Nostocales cyanobacterium 94392]
MMKTSKNRFPYFVAKLVPTFLILTTITASYNSAVATATENIANDKSLVLPSNKVSLQQTKTQPIAEPLTKQLDKSPEAVNTEQMKQVAKHQNATIVQYSIIADESPVNGKREIQESELYIWVIKPTGDMQFRRVDLKAWEKIEKNSFFNLFIRRTRPTLGARSINLKGSGLKIKPEDKTLQFDLKKLHQVLIEPIADLLPQKPEERVIFIPQGELFTVPFAALQDANNKYLIEKHTISTSPSIQVLDLLYQRKKERKDEKPFVPKNITGDELLIVGNPTAPKTPLTAGSDNCKASRLPGAEKEAKIIAEMFQTQPLIGDAATETAIVQKMPQARIIHLATYTFAENCQKEDSPGVIALATSEGDDGWLRTGEIQNLNLKADLVVLTGCDTALGRITGDGIIGLSRAFLGAGADSVIGSLWDVDDISTAALMTEFYGKLSENTDKAGALRQAMLETMKKYPNPSDWAGFTLVGLL